MRNIHEILTPENVCIKYELAGLGSRFVAMVIDTLVQGALLLVVLIIMSIAGFDFNSTTDLNSIVVAIGIILLFLILFGYFVFFEMLTDGRSPGKMAAGLRVVKQTGQPLGFIDSLIRNVLRIADMLPSIYLTGAVFIIFTKKYKRIGDFAANTVVIKVRKYKSFEAPDEPDLNAWTAALEETKLNRFPVTNLEYEVLREFLQRQNGLGDRRALFIYHLNRYFVRKFNYEMPGKHDPVVFFREIVRANSD